MDLPKSQKKIARRIIETGLEREYEMGIEKIDQIISLWKNKDLNNRDAYLEIYDSLTKHDKQIERRYDNISGSKYLFIVASLLADKIIFLDELNDLAEDIRNKIIFISRINED